MYYFDGSFYFWLTGIYYSDGFWIDGQGIFCYYFRSTVWNILTGATIVGGSGVCQSPVDSGNAENSIDQINLCVANGHCDSQDCYYACPTKSN